MYFLGVVLSIMMPLTCILHFIKSGHPFQAEQSVSVEVLNTVSFTLLYSESFHSVLFSKTITVLGRVTRKSFSYFVFKLFTYEIPLSR